MRPRFRLAIMVRAEDRTRDLTHHLTRANTTRSTGPRQPAAAPTDPMTHTEIVSFIWNVANLIRDSFKRGKYQDVILPLTVLRRLDCVLAPTKEKVLARNAELKDRGLEDRRHQLERASGFAFYNTSRYDFDRLLADAPEVAANLRNYIAGFSENMRTVVERFDFDNTISKLDEAGLLFQVLERFRKVDLHPNMVDNPTMGTIFEELIRRFYEALDENPGEHFTPRYVVHLMVDLMLVGDEARISGAGVVRSVYDPCCGSGGMLMIAKEHILQGRKVNGSVLRPAINSQAEIHLFGQEVNPETWALSKSDFFMKDPTGRDARKIAFGSTLSNDRHEGRHFDYLIANPPYGKDWKRDKAAVKAEHERGAAGRFRPGLPRISDAQTLFLLHMLARAKVPAEGGTRIAIIMNGSVCHRPQRGYEEGRHQAARANQEGDPDGAGGTGRDASHLPVTGVASPSRTRNFATPNVCRCPTETTRRPRWGFRRASRSSSIAMSSPMRPTPGSTRAGAMWGTGRLRDQLQPLLLPLQAAPAAWEDQGRHPQGRA